MLREMGYTNGVEKLPCHMDGRSGSESRRTPFLTFPEDFLIMIDESQHDHGAPMGMYNGDCSRKEMLVNYGFRLPSALDNRPLRRRALKAMSTRLSGCQRHQVTMRWNKWTPSSRAKSFVRCGLLGSPGGGKRVRLWDKWAISARSMRVERGERTLSHLTKKAEDLTDY